jgi:hypothetical protein
MDVVAKVPMKLGYAAVESTPSIAGAFGGCRVMGQCQHLHQHGAMVRVLGTQNINKLLGVDSTTSY